MTGLALYWDPGHPLPWPCAILPSSEAYNVLYQHEMRLSCPPFGSVSLPVVPDCRRQGEAHVAEEAPGLAAVPGE